MSNSPIIYGGSNNLGKTLLPPTSSGASTVDTSGNIGTIGIGTALGLATLDASGKIPSSELPSTVLQYQGLWNPATNTPTLLDATGTNGYVYQVSTAFAGSIIGLNNATMINFQIGNLVIFSSSINQWEQTTPAAGVQSVNGAQGNVTVNAINQLTGDGTAGPASGSQSEVFTLTATSNSTLVTLPALSLPYSQVTGTPTFADSLVNTAGTVTLVNDTATPGASQYYGTNSGSTLGYYALPATGTGTVTTVSVVSSNGLAGTVANATTTPAITLSTTITGVLKGNGTAISAATAGTDYVIPSGSITGTSGNVTGVVAIANGGTDNGSLAVTAGGLIYTDGTKFQNVGVGTTGQLLQSNGSSAPTWVTTALTSVNASYGISGNVAVSANAAIIWNVLKFDTNSAMNTSTGVYTVPTTGKYLISVGVTNSTASTSVFLNRNGTNYVNLCSMSSINLATSGSVIISCSASDTLSIISQASVTYVAGTPSTTYISIARVGS